MSEPLVPIEELAKHFTVSVSTVRAWVRQGLIPKETYVKLGSTYRFSISRVESALLKTPKDESAPVQELNAPIQLELNFNDPDKDV